MKALKNDKGFAIAPILLAIALIGVIAGAVAISSRTATLSTVEQSAKTSAATILQQLANLDTGYSIMLSKALHPSEITWDAAPGTGLFNPTDGGTTMQIPPAVALVDPATNPGYVYKVDASRRAVVKVRDVGVNSVDDYVVALTNVKKSVCEEINRIMLGSPTIPAGAGTLSAWRTAATAIDMSSATYDPIARRTTLCIRTTDTPEAYVVFDVLKEQ